MNNHKAKHSSINKNLTKGMSMASRAASKSKEEPESQPLTRAQFDAIRLEEAKERERIRKLRESWNEHEASIRRSPTFR